MRANMLNSREPCDGTPRSLPRSVCDPEMITKSLELDWNSLVNIFRNCILNGRKTNINIGKTIRFGNEIVNLRNQFFRRFHVNHLLKLFLFGSPLFSSIHSHEIIYRTNKVVILHLFSHRRINDLLSLGGLKACTFIKDNRKYVCCAKVNLKLNGKSVVGFVIDEEDECLIVEVQGIKDNIRCKRPKFESAIGNYVYDNSICSPDEFIVSEIWPLCLKLNTSGQSSFVLSRTSFNLDISESTLN